MAGNSRRIDSLAEKVSDLAIRHSSRIEGRSLLECLPNEVLEMIELSQGDLFSMTLVNRQLKAVFLPLLHRYFHLDVFNEYDGRHVTYLINMAFLFARSPERAKAVQSLRLCGISDDLARLVQDSVEEKLTGFKSRCWTPNIYNFFWGLLPNLRELSFRIGTQSQMDSLTILSSPKLEMVSITGGVLPNLRQNSFTVAGDQLGIPIRKCGKVLDLPVLKNLRVVLRGEDRIFHAALPQRPQRRPLESLDVQGANLDSKSLEVLLSNLEGLRSFRMRQPTVTECLAKSHSRESVSLDDEVYAALFVFRETLEEVRLDVAQIAPCCHPGDRMKTFARFRKLRSLLVNPDQLGELPYSHPDFSQFLPPSLETLMLVCPLNPYPRPRRYWFDLLESIALGQSRLPALRKVAVEFVYTLERAPDITLFQPNIIMREVSIQYDRYRTQCRDGRWTHMSCIRCSACTDGGEEWRSVVQTYLKSGIILEVGYANASGGMEGIPRDLLEEGIRR